MKNTTPQDDTFPLLMAAAVALLWAVCWYTILVKL